MNVFNAIKYPIHLPLDGEQLRAIPKDIYRNWVTRVVLAEGRAGRKNHAYFLHEAFVAYFNNIPEEYHEEYITDLRNRILSYEEL